MFPLFEQVVVKGEGIFLDGVGYIGTEGFGVESVGGIFESKEGNIGS